MRRSNSHCLALTFVALVPLGCQARILVPSDGDAFRHQIRTLEARVNELEANNAELTANLATARSSLPMTSTVATGDAQAAILAETPRAVRLVIVSGSSIEHKPSDPAHDELTLYLETLDSRDRFVQVAGTLSVSVLSLPSPGQGEPIRLGGLDLNPKELRDTWRSGLFGTHYTITLPLDLSRANGAASAAISVEIREGVEGRRLPASTTMELVGAHFANRTASP